MTRVVVLDSGPLGMIIHPRSNPALRDWLRRLRSSGTPVVLPEIVDYEIRRELLRLKNRRSIERLETLAKTLWYRPITTAVMLRAAEYWAKARQRGRPTADPQALDVDVILSAQADEVRGEGFDPVIATTNVGHLELFVEAKRWTEIA